MLKSHNVVFNTFTVLFFLLITFLLWFLVAGLSCKRNKIKRPTLYCRHPSFFPPASLFPPYRQLLPLIHRHSIPITNSLSSHSHFVTSSRLSMQVTDGSSSDACQLEQSNWVTHVARGHSVKPEPLFVASSSCSAACFFWSTELAFWLGGRRAKGHTRRHRKHIWSARQKKWCITVRGHLVILEHGRALAHKWEKYTPVCTTLLLIDIFVSWKLPHGISDSWFSFSSSILQTAKCGSTLPESIAWR